MSTYNMVNGHHPLCGVLLSCLGFNNTTLKTIPRLRDCFINKGNIVILTRTGGGNRDDYVAENEALRKIPGYISDNDDPFDGTFAWFRYAFPAEFLEELTTAEALHGSYEPFEEFKKRVAAM